MWDRFLHVAIFVHAGPLRLCSFPNPTRPVARLPDDRQPVRRRARASADPRPDLSSSVSAARSSASSPSWPGRSSRDIGCRRQSGRRQLKWLLLWPCWSGSAAVGDGRERDGVTDRPPEIGLIVFGFAGASSRSPSASRSCATTSTRSTGSSAGRWPMPSSPAPWPRSSSAIALGLQRVLGRHARENTIAGRGLDALRPRPLPAAPAPSPVGRRPTLRSTHYDARADGAGVRRAHA